MFISKIVTTLIGEKRSWWEYKARVKRLPENYRMAIEAVERYLMHAGPGDGPNWAAMLDDLAALFEQSAADGTPIREIFGDDPVEFVETFIQNYPEGRWRARERERLTRAVERAAGEQTGSTDR